MATTADYKLGEFTFPRGWFMIGRSADATRTPAAVRFFGEDLVLYRGESGRVVLMEAYCPHMGTHLARNTTSYIVKDGDHVTGDSIRCPYHGWRFGHDGRCDHIPYSPASPPKAARLKNWPVTERAGGLWVWNDPEGQEPDYNLPAFEQWDAPHWVNWNLCDLGGLACHPQEIVDNICDRGHLDPVHGSINMVYFHSEFEGHVSRQILCAGHKTLASDSGNPMTNDTWYTGPGILQSTMVGEHPSLMLIAHTPVDDGSVKVWYGLLVKVAGRSPQYPGSRTRQGLMKTPASTPLRRISRSGGTSAPCIPSYDGPRRWPVRQGAHLVSPVLQSAGSSRQVSRDRVNGRITTARGTR